MIIKKSIFNRLWFGVLIGLLIVRGYPLYSVLRVNLQESQLLASIKSMRQPQLSLLCYFLTQTETSFRGTLTSSSLCNFTVVHISICRCQVCIGRSAGEGLPKWSSGFRMLKKSQVIRLFVKRGQGRPDQYDEFLIPFYKVLFIFISVESTRLAWKFTVGGTSIMRQELSHLLLDFNWRIELLLN